ncbi:MAG: PucR family transcriptional regulator [Coriobacteriaceae bacterium]|nr:PucR family transcriptional regulator [Coriobacteriaceae bacterium]
MSLTLNIIEHELRSLGMIVRTEENNLEFEDFRIYLGPDSLKNQDMLYLTSDRASTAQVRESGYYALYVNPKDEKPDENAVISVLEGSDALVTFNALLEVFFQYGSWERDMDTLFSTGGDLQDLLDISTSFLKNNVVILDPALKLLAYTKDVPCDDRITEELISHGYHTDENIRKFKLHKRFKPWSEDDGFIINDTYEICKYVTVVRSFKTSDSFSLIIVMMCNVSEPKGYLLDAYEMFAERVGRYAMREYPDDKPSGTAIDTFLRDLFVGGAGDREAVRERANTMGLPQDARFCLFYIGSYGDNVPPHRLLADVSRIAAPAKTVSIGDSIVVLCFNCQSDRCALHCETGSCPLGHRSMSARLNDLMQKYDLVCGRSSKFKQIEAARDAYNQAREAHDIGVQKVGQRENLDLPHDWSRIFSFDRCCVDYLVKQCGESNLATHTYASFVLDHIAERDTTARTDNYEFLYEYLINERRTSVVAEKLHMHRNNVKYRIDRIESQYGIDTEDPSMRFDFLLAYRVRESAIVQNAQKN